MNKVAWLSLLMAFVCTGVTQAQVQVGKSGELSGRVFSDYYWIAQNHNSDLEGNNGFWIRRIYLTYENQLDSHFSTRLRLEMDNPGDFQTSSKMIPVVKDAYLKWDNGQHALYAGIAGSPTWGLVEDVWGYRALEKSPLDLQGLGSSRDFGVAAKGEFGPDGKVGYHLMLGNGNSNRSEVDKGKKVMLSLHYQITDHLVVEAYGDYNRIQNEQYVSTYQGFLAYQSDHFTVGGLFAHQYRSNADDNLNIASLFGHFTISDEIRGIIRADHMFEPNPDGDGIDYLPFSTEANATLLVAGLDLKLQNNVSLIPNVETVVYGENDQGVQPKSDIIPRLTLSYRF
jgi:hypothetical protein